MTDRLRSEYSENKCHINRDKFERCIATRSNIHFYNQISFYNPSGKLQI